jgi:SAM-dependent methyltransferase
MNNSSNEINMVSIKLEDRQICNQTQITESEWVTKEIEFKNIKYLNKEDHSHKFYTFPKYYDMAFSRDVDSDIKFFENCFHQYSDFNVKRVLEPACGTGIFLENLPRYGYSALGYDLSKDMVAYSKERLKNAGINQENAEVVLGDMKNLEFDSKFDAAFICINSLGYLNREEDINSHFNAMGNSIKKGGIYIIEISCKCEDLANEKKPDDIWYVKEDGIELEIGWVIKRYDMDKRIRHVEFRMVVNDNNKHIIVEEAHELRLWLFDEFKKFANNGGFKIVGIYNQKYEQISENTPINGELGGLFFILKNIKCN